jgi:hypothetical protein
MTSSRPTKRARVADVDRLPSLADLEGQPRLADADHYLAFSVQKETAKLLKTYQVCCSVKADAF